MRYFVVLFFVAASVWGQPEGRNMIINGHFGLTPPTDRLQVNRPDSSPLIVRDATGNVRIWAGMLDSEPVIAMLTEDGTPTFFQTANWPMAMHPLTRTKQIRSGYYGTWIGSPTLELHQEWIPAEYEDYSIQEVPKDKRTPYERRAIQLMQHLGKWPTPTPRASDLVRSSTPCIYDATVTIEG